MQKLSNLAASTEGSAGKKVIQDNSVDQTKEGSHSRAVRYCSNIPIKSVRDSQRPGVTPRNREIFNGFKSRLKESLLLEQARSLHKDDAIATFIKKTNELNVYAMGGDSIDTGGDQEES